MPLPTLGSLPNSIRTPVTFIVLIYKLSSWTSSKHLEGRSFVIHLCIPSTYWRVCQIVNVQYILRNKTLVEIWSVPTTEKTKQEKRNFEIKSKANCRMGQRTRREKETKARSRIGTKRAHSLNTKHNWQMNGISDRAFQIQ